MSSLPTLTTVFDAYQLSLLEAYIDNKISLGESPIKTYIVRCTFDELGAMTIEDRYNTTTLTTENPINVGAGHFEIDIVGTLDAAKIYVYPVFATVVLIFYNDVDSDLNKWYVNCFDYNWAAVDPTDTYIDIRMDIYP